MYLGLYQTNENDGLTPQNAELLRKTALAVRFNK